jgi:hypothetical protein
MAGDMITVDDENILHSFNDFPALKTQAFTCWCKHGKFYRINGPAIIEQNALQKHKWFVNGIRCYSVKTFQFYSKLPDEDICVLILKYGHIS